MFMALIDEKSEQKQFESIYAGYRPQMLAVAYRILEETLKQEFICMMKRTAQALRMKSTIIPYLPYRASAFAL